MKNPENNSNNNRANFLLKYAKPNLHYTLKKDPEVYLRCSVVCYEDLLNVLTSDHYSTNVKIMAVFHPLADFRILELASSLNIPNINTALLAQDNLPEKILMQLIRNEDHQIRVLAAKHKNATQEMGIIASTDPHPLVRSAAKSAD